MFPRHGTPRWEAISSTCIGSMTVAPCSWWPSWAFLSGWDVLPHLRIGTAYVSAARHAAVGGDLFDVHRIDDRRSLFVVAELGFPERLGRAAAPAHRHGLCFRGTARRGGRRSLRRASDR